MDGACRCANTRSSERAFAYSYTKHVFNDMHKKSHGFSGLALVDHLRMKAMNEALAQGSMVDGATEDELAAVTCLKDDLSLRGDNLVVIFRYF